MPTGYTDKLYKGEDQSFEDFVARCARAFGATIMQRDESLDVGLKLRKPSTDYHVKQIEKAIVKRAKAKEWTAEEAEVEAAKDFQERYDEWQRANKKNEERRKRYMDMLEKVKDWTPPTKDHTRLKSFMTKQLQDSIEFDCNMYDKPEPRTGEEHRTHDLESAEWELDYHFERIVEEYKRAEESNKWIKPLADDLGLDLE